MINFEQEYSRLNKQQKQAVDTIEGPVMVIAGPGTGKTQTIALRIANILKQTQVSAYNILCLTFTEAAVTAMRQRLVKMIGPLAYEVSITTFHGFCNEVIKSNPDAFPQVISGIEPVLDSDKVRIILGCIDELDPTSLLRPFKKPDTYLYDVSSLISSLKRENLRPGQLKAMFEQQKTFFIGAKEAFEGLAAIRYNKLTDATFSEFITSIAKSTQQGDPHVGYLVQLIEFLKEDLADLSESKQRTAMRKELVSIYKKYGDEQQIEKSIDFVTVYQGYQDKIAELGVYDYEDMISFVLDAFESEEHLLRRYQERYQYVLVDEYQDTNSSQNKAVDLLTSFFDSPNVFVVGDDDQAVYRFQGASVENVFDFYEQFQDSLEVVTLTNNYRSQQRILDAARDIITHNSSRIDKVIPDIDKSLESQLDIPKIPVDVVETSSPTAELLYVSAKVQELLNNGVPASEIAILYRNNKDVDTITEVFAKEGISFNKTKGVNILEDGLIKQVIQLLRYISEPLDQVMLVQVLHSKFFELDQLDLMKVYRCVYKQRGSVTEAIESANYLSDLELANTEAITNQVGLISRWHDLSFTQELPALFETLIHEAGIVSYIFEQENKYELLEYLGKLFEEIKKYSRNQSESGLKGFLAHLDVLQNYGIALNQESKVDYANAVQLLTAHGSKGLEFEYVFIVKAQDKKWGNSRKSSKIKIPLQMFDLIPGGDLEEERRLFFVALTRAKKQAFISYANTNEDQKTILPSQFISEIGSLHKNEVFIESDSKDLLDFTFEAPTPLVVGQDGREYLESILVGYSISPTHLVSYRRCPRCFLLTSLLKLPTSRSPVAAYGTAMHAVMRDMLNYLKNKKELLEDKVVVDKFLGYLEKENLSKEDFEVYSQNGEVIIGDYYKYKKGLLEESSVAELSVSTVLELDNNLKIPINGKIDRVDYLDSTQKIATVADYKTGNPDGKYKELNVEKLGDYYLQLVFYKFLLESSREIKVDAGIIDFVEPSKRKKDYISKRIDFENEGLSTARGLIQEVYRGIMGLDFDRCNEKDCYTPHLHELEVRL